MGPSLQERIGVNEVQIDHLEEKIDDLKNDVNTMKVDLHAKLTEMQEASTRQHGELGAKISEMQKFKDRWINYGVAGFVILTFIGAHLDKILPYLSR